MPKDDYFPILEDLHKLPPGILKSVMKQESGGNPAAVSPKGAKGLFQFMDPTAQQYGIDPYDPVQAASAAARMLGELNVKYQGDLSKVLAGYNWGQGNVDRQGIARAPEETRNYIQKVTANMPKGQVTRDVQVMKAGRDFSAELFGDEPEKPALGAKPSERIKQYMPQEGRDFSAELFGEEPAATPAPQGVPAAVGQPQPSAGQQMWGGSAPPSPDAQQFRAPFRQQLHRGIMDTYQGAKQLALNVGEKAGIVDPSTAANYNKQVTEEMALYAAHNPGFQPGRLLGSVASIPVTPGAGSLGRAALTGAALASTQAVPGETDEFWKTKGIQAATGAVAGPAVQALLTKVVTPLVGKTVGAIRNHMQPAAQEIMDLGRQHGVPLTAGDISLNKLTRHAEDVLSNVPLAGVSREAQQTAARAASAKMAQRLRDQMINAGFKGTAQVERAAAHGSKAAAALQREIAAAGDDWGRIIQTSGNVQAFRHKLIADKLYDKVAEEAAGLGSVGLGRTNAALDNARLQLSQALVPDEGATALITRIQTRLQDPNTPTNFGAVRAMRSELGDMISDFYKGQNAVTGAKGVRVLQGLRDAVDDDLRNFALNSGNPGLQRAWKRADAFYANNLVPFKNSELARALKGADPDTIYGKFIQSGKGDRAARFYQALDPKGKDAVRYGMVAEAFDKAADPVTGAFDPGRFSTALTRTQDAQGVFFKGAAKAEVDGLTKLMRHVERAGPGAQERGQGAHRLVAAGAGGMALGVPQSAAFTVPIMVALKVLTTTEGGKRMLSSANMLKPGTNAMANMVARMNALVTEAAALGAGGEQAEPGRVLP